jgi:lipopolysaccharide export system permease protein
VTFIISMFMLIMQFFWKYIDDLMGKGLEISIILELLLYVSASLIPLALPLAMLLSSIMTFGNLAENNELTALKSSGLSLYKIMRPLMVVVLLISLGTFYFSNYIIPIATLKWKALIYDIQETKISKIITPGSYSNELEGLAIKVKNEKNGVFYDVVIHDHNDPNIVKTVRSKQATLYNSSHGNFLYLHLKNGSVLEELGVNQSINLESRNRGSYYPSRRSSFTDATYKISLKGFKLNRTDENLFKNNYEMLNVFQINQVTDSIILENNKVLLNFSKSLKKDFKFFLPNDVTKIIEITIDSNQHTSKLDFKKLPKVEQNDILGRSISMLERDIESIKGQRDFIKTFESNLNLYNLEYHRKFALTFAIIVLFFVGAPLGAIVRKGGFGAPVVIACLLFMVYFILTEVGEGLVTSGSTSPVIGMWLATFVLSPLALLLMRSAANDSKVFDKEAWLKKMNKLKK